MADRLPAPADRVAPAGSEPEPPPFIDEAAAYFGVTNECADGSHPYGIHRHGASRYVRRAPDHSPSESPTRIWPPGADR